MIACKIIVHLNCSTSMLLKPDDVLHTTYCIFTEGRMPAETLTAEQLKAAFEAKGLSVREMVALSGAHTIGVYKPCKNNIALHAWI